jgi:uncharacterized protein (DUF2267 family)
MSGPKCGEWSVEANFERERRIASELRADIDHVRSALDAARAKWSAAVKKYGDDFPAPPAPETRLTPESSDNDTLRVVLEQLRRRLTSVEQQLAEAQSIHRMRDLLAKAELYEELETASEAKKMSSPVNYTSIRKEKLVAILSKLDPNASTDDRSAIENLAEEALSKIDVTKFEGILLEIRFRIQKSNQKKQDRDRMITEAQALLDRLTGLENPDVLRLKKELFQVRRGETNLRAGVEVEVS